MEKLIFKGFVNVDDKGKRSLVLKNANDSIFWFEDLDHVNEASGQCLIESFWIRATCATL